MQDFGFQAFAVGAVGHPGDDEERAFAGQGHLLGGGQRTDAAVPRSPCVLGKQRSGAGEGEKQGEKAREWAAKRGRHAHGENLYGL